MKVFNNELMSRHTTFKVGGPCEALINPESIYELIEIIKELKKKNTPYYVIGNGSNILVSDNGIKSVVIEISAEMSDAGIVEENGNEVIVFAESGIKLSRLAAFAYKEGLTGLEFAAGIPGTLGGAVFMNAGAYDGEMANIVQETLIYDVNEDKIVTFEKEQHEFGYRSSIFHKNSGIILKNRLKLFKDDREAIKAKMEDFADKRRSKQPLEYPSAGSTFKRPEGYFAGKLIEDTGLRGYMIGGAQVSEKHCGFIINKNNASASDILKLIDYVKAQVLNKFGVELKEEVRII